MQYTRRGRHEAELEFGASGANTLGEAVRTWRHQRGLTVTELAILAGFGPSGRSYISKVEHGAIRRLGAARLRAIAESLQIRLEDLLPRVAATDQPGGSSSRHVESSDAQIDAWAAIDQALSAQPSSTPQGDTQWDETPQTPAFSHLPHIRELLTEDLISANVEQMIDGFLLQLEASCQVQIHRFLQENVRARLNALIQGVLANVAPDRDVDQPRSQPLASVCDPPAEEPTCLF